jgi:hypothetical protein
VGADDLTDLAVVRAEASGLPPLVDTAGRRTLVIEPRRQAA